MWCVVALVLPLTFGAGGSQIEQALSAEQGGNDARALSMLDAIVRDQPTWELPRMEAARIRMKQGAELDRAEFDLDVAVALAPENPRAQYLWGLVREERGAEEQALRSYAVAVEYRPSYDDARLRLAGLLFARGDLAGAEVHYRELARRHPDMLQARLQLVSIFERQGRLDEAEAELVSLWSDQRSRIAGRRLLELYERSGQNAKATKLRAELEPKPAKKMRPLKKSRR